MGDPPINFLDVRKSSSEASVIDDTIVGENSEDVTQIGIRPEDIYVVDPATGDPLVDDVDAELSEPVPVTTDVIEPLGNAYEVTLTREDVQITARMRALPEEMTAGSEISIGFDLGNVHRFNAQGMRIE